MATPDANAVLPTNGRWQRISPLASLHFLALSLKRQVLNAGQLVGTLALLLLLLRQGFVATIVGIVCLFALALVIAALRYWFFRFRLDAERLRIRQGVLRKTVLELQFDRIQGVAVEQPLIFRWLGLVTVGFDTAGSTQQEGRLPGVKPDFAAALRARIEGAKRHPDAEPAATLEAPEPLPAEGDQDGQTVLRLDSAEIVRIGLADRGVLTALAVLPVMWPTLDGTLRDRLLGTVDEAAASVAQLGVMAVVVVTAGALLTLVVALLAITVATAFLRYHGFTLFEARGGKSLRTRRGLLTRKAMAVDRAKIQQVKLSQTLLMRWFGRFRLLAPPAAVRALPSTSEEEGVAASVLHVPMLAPEQVRPLADRVFAGEDAGLSLLPARDPFVRISPVYIRARVQTVGVVPGLLALVALYPVIGPASLLCLSWPLLVALCAWQLWRRRAYMHNDHGLSYRAGLLGYKVEAFLFRKAQSVIVSQSPLQRRARLASLDVTLASGAVTLPFIDHATACRLRDHILFAVESTDRPWH